MKDTLSTNQVADRLFDDKNAGWTYDGARALAEYLDQIEEDTGEEMELDVVAIRCDFSEYASALECVADYNADIDENADEEEKEKQALQWLEEQTQVITFDNGIIIQQF